MPTTADYLNDLVAQKKALAENLNTKGVSASDTETLNTLVPKVLEISDENYDEGYADGKQEQYDTFWDANQQNGNRAIYQMAYLGHGWDFSNFYPKYDIVAKGNAQAIFYSWCITKNHTGSLKARLNECKVSLDLSQCNNLKNAFQYSNFTELPGITIPVGAATDGMFANSPELTTIEGLTVYKGTVFTKCFDGDSKLTNISFTEGSQVGNNIDFSTCPLLSRDSLLNIISVLFNYVGTGTTKTLSLGTTNLAKLTDEEKAVATEKGWTLA